MKGRISPRNPSLSSSMSGPRAMTSLVILRACVYCAGGEEKGHEAPWNQRDGSKKERGNLCRGKKKKRKKKREPGNSNLPDVNVVLPAHLNAGDAQVGDHGLHPAQKKEKEKE